MTADHAQDPPPVNRGETGADVTNSLWTYGIECRKVCTVGWVT